MGPSPKKPTPFPKHDSGSPIYRVPSAYKARRQNTRRDGPQTMHSKSL